jgi:hypothetical protein
VKYILVTISFAVLEFVLIQRIFRIIKKNNRLLNYGEKSIGEIISYNEYENNDGDRVWRPMIKFQTKSGKIVVKEIQMDYYKPSLLKKKQKVYYNEKNPMDFVVDNFIVAWGEVLLLAIGAIVTIIIFIALWKNDFQLKSPSPDQFIH